MKILLVTRAGFLKHPGRYFNNEYHGIKMVPEIAGGFGWFWVKALRELGHEVRPFIFYKNPALDYLIEINQFIHRCKYKFSFFTKFPNYLMNKKLIKVSLDYKPELILIDAGELIYPETISRIKQISNAKIVNWLLDDPYKQGWMNVIKSMSLYDIIFTYEQAHIKKFKEMGSPSVDYLPCACDPDIHRTFSLTEREKNELKSELCFIGAVTLKRAEILNALTEFELGIWTYGKLRMEKDSIFMKHYRGFAWGELSSKIFNAAKIVFNIHHPQSILAVNMRTFETAGCGAFQLVDRRNDINNLFKIGEEIICYKDIKELKELIKYYLDNPQERIRIAQRAQQRAHQEHTYKHRLSRLIVTVARSL